MRPSAPRRPLYRPALLALSAGVLSAWLAPSASFAQAKPQQPSSSGIYTCTSPDGRRLTSDRPIPECQQREQRMLNSDGSVRKMVPPSMSPEEQAAADQRRRNEELQRAIQQDAIRRDRNLMLRFPDEPAHKRAREAALDDIRQAMEQSEKRIKELSAERKPMLDEAEFYKGKRLPVKLQHQLETNEVAADAQRQSIDNQKAEIVRVNKLYDEDLARLKRLWAGATPGTLERPQSPASGR